MSAIALPNDAAVARLQVVTAAAANTLTSTPLIAAPAVPKRLRIWAWQLAADNTWSGDLLVFIAADGGGTNLVAYGALSDELRFIGYGLPGGVRMGAGDQLQISVRATGVSQKLFVSVAYTVDPA